MTRVLRALRGALASPFVRWGFLVLAVGIATVYAVQRWDELVQAAARLSGWSLTAVVVLGFAYVGCTLIAWRTVLADLGSPLSIGTAVSVFGLSQLGKYVPGGVWNVVAAAEIGAGHRIPRARSLAAMAVAVLVSVVSGAAVGALAFPFVGAAALGSWSWLVWALPVVAVALVPPVLNRIIGTVLRLGRRQPLEHPLTWRGLGRSTAWSVAGWLVAGLQLWLLATGVGLEVSSRTFALAVSGWALAWVVGFLVVVAPAGAGVREAVLVAVFAGSLSDPAVGLTVLLSRVVLTVVDLAFAGVGLIVVRRGRRAPTAITVP